MSSTAQMKEEYEGRANTSRIGNTRASTENCEVSKGLISNSKRNRIKWQLLDTHKV